MRPTLDVGDRRPLARYVLNLRTGVVHRLPSQESCNADQIPVSARKRSKDRPGGVYRYCGHRFQGGRELP